MNNWLKTYLAGTTVQPLLADIKAGRVKTTAVLLAVQKLSKEEKQEIQPALDLILEAVTYTIGERTG